MSQYPPPYPSGPYAPAYNYYQPGPDLLAPARRASILMFILTAVMGLGGLCCVGGGLLIPQTMHQHPEFFRNMQLPPGATPMTMRREAMIDGVLTLLPAVAMIVLAVFVRRGGLGASVTSIVLVGLILVLLLLSILGAIAQGAMGGGPQLFLGACIMLLPAALFILLLVWLIQAARAAPRVKMFQQQYQAQMMWQYHQQQAAQSGYGSQAQPPPTVQPPLPGDSHGPSSQG